MTSLIMLNQFKQAAIRAVARHKVVLQYTQQTTGNYDIETGKPALVRTTHTVTMYPKQFIANQYNFPTLVGKETIMFFLVNHELGFEPKEQDEIQYKGFVYKVQSRQEHGANGEVILYKLVATRG